MGLSVREELHKMIDEADDERLDEIYGLLNDDGTNYSKYSDEDLEMFYSRLEEHEAGGGKNYTIEEVFNMVRNKKK